MCPQNERTLANSTTLLKGSVVSSQRSMCSNTQNVEPQTQQTHKGFMSLRNHDLGDDFHFAQPRSLNLNRKCIQQVLKLCGIMLILKKTAELILNSNAWAPRHSVQKPDHLPSILVHPPPPQQSGGPALGAWSIASCLRHQARPLLSNLKAKGPTHSNTLLTGKCVLVGKFLTKQYWFIHSGSRFKEWLSSHQIIPTLLIKLDQESK